MEKGRKGENTNNLGRFSSLSGCVATLDSTDPKKVMGALVAIRKRYLKEKDGIARLKNYGGIQKLLKILNTFDNGYLDVGLSILGNAATDQSARKLILSEDGVELLNKVIRSKTTNSIWHRALRSIANICMDQEGCETVHTTGLAKEEGKILKYADDVKSLVETIVLKGAKLEDGEEIITFIRTIRLLADTKARMSNILSVYGLKAVAVYLESSEKSVQVAALKGVSHFTDMMLTEEMIWQLTNAKAFASILELVTSTNAEIHQLSTTLLLSFANYELLRPPLGNAGAIEYFAKKIQTGLETNRQPKQILPYANAFCLMSQEVGNRVRMKEGDLLPLFLKVLRKSDFRKIHDRVVSALCCFIYDCESFDILLQNKLLHELIYQLRITVKFDCRGKDDLQGPFFDEISRTDICLCEVGSSELTLITENTDDAKRVPKPGSSKTKCEEDTPKSACDETLTKCGENSSKYIENSNKFEENSNRNKSNGDGSCTSNASRNTSCTNAYIDKVELSLVSQQQSVEADTVMLESDTKEEVKIEKEEKTDIDIDKGWASDTELPSTSKTKRHKYSINSPTYKAISVFKPDDSYEEGPKNLAESANYYQNLSPNYTFPSSPQSTCYSPLSTSTYASPDHNQSPVSSPISFLGSPSSGCDPWGSPPAGSSPRSIVGGSSESSPSTSRFHTSHSCPQFSPPRGVSPLSPSSDSNQPWSPLQFSVGASSPLSQGSPASEFSPLHEPDPRLEKSPNDKESETENSLNDKKVDFNDESPIHVPSDGIPQSTSAIEIDQSTEKRKVFEKSTNVNQNTESSLLGTSSAKRKIELDSPVRKRKRVVKRHSVDMIMRNMEKQKKIVKDDKEETKKVHDEIDLKCAHRITEKNTIVILSHASYLDKLKDGDSYSKVLDTLIEYIKYSKKPFQRASRILNRVTKSALSFEKHLLYLLPSKFDLVFGLADSECSTQKREINEYEVSKAFHLYDTCSKCKKTIHACSDTNDLLHKLLANLSIIAESKFGKGVFAHVLLSKSNAKQQVALAIPHLCRTKESLYKMLVDYKGLDWILSPILSHQSITRIERKRDQPVDDQKDKTNDDEILIGYVVRSLYVLARSIGIKLPFEYTLNNKRAEDCVLKVRCDRKREISRELELVTEDGEVVFANRRYLTDRSSVFEAMLSGNFTESKQSRVTIKEVRGDSLQLFMLLIHNEIRFPENIIGVEYSEENSEEGAKVGALLDSGHSETDTIKLDLDLCCDLLELCERFMTPDYVEDIINVIVKYLCDLSTVDCIYNFAKVHGIKSLIGNSIRYVLTAPMSTFERSEIFLACFNSDPPTGVRHLKDFFLKYLQK